MNRKNWTHTQDTSLHTLHSYTQQVMDICTLLPSRSERHNHKIIAQIRSIEESEEAAVTRNGLTPWFKLPVVCHWTMTTGQPLQSSISYHNPTNTSHHNPLCISGTANSKTIVMITELSIRLVEFEYEVNGSPCPYALNSKRILESNGLF